MIDKDGFRPNVGIILCNDDRRLLWARRVRRAGWQFPQGGIDGDEAPEDAMYRELYEEVGLQPAHVEIIGKTRGWLRYRLPHRYRRSHGRPHCVGQKQVYFLLRLVGSETDVKLNATDSPEFDHWCWIDYWQPVKRVVYFKRRVYERALTELEPVLFSDGVSSTTSSTDSLES